MILGIGTDITDIARTEKIFACHGERFVKSILSPAEQTLCESKKNGKAVFLAGRWAAKEAIAKAFGCGICEKCLFREMEILPGPSGAPHVTLFGNTAQNAEKMLVKKIHLSISHEKQFAVAMALLEG